MREVSIIGGDFGDNVVFGIDDVVAFLSGDQSAALTIRVLR
jgi:hypothetical protein